MFSSVFHRSKKQHHHNSSHHLHHHEDLHLHNVNTNIVLHHRRRQRNHRARIGALLTKFFAFGIISFCLFNYLLLARQQELQHDDQHDTFSTYHHHHSLQRHLPHLFDSSHHSLVERATAWNVRRKQKHVTSDNQQQVERTRAPDDNKYEEEEDKYDYSDPDPLAVLHYAPSRIPGYVTTTVNDDDDNTKGKTKTTMALYGHVMRELVTRICARQIAQSNILVLSPEAPYVVDWMHQQEQQQLHSNSNQKDEASSLQRQLQHAVGGSTLLHVHRQGHATFGLNSTTTATTTKSSTTSTTVVNDWWTSFDTAQAAQRPGWILMTMYDHGWQNDVLMQDSAQLLQEATLTYIVLGIGAYPSSHTTTDAASSYGQKAIQDLLRHKYKVQMLSLSHMATEVYMQDLVQPNADITSTNVAALFEGLQEVANTTQTPVLGYVFATQGLDLAIPTATYYQPKLPPLLDPTNFEKHSGITYRECNASDHHRLRIAFVLTDPSSSSETFANDTPPPIIITCNDKVMDPLKSATALTDIWYSGDTIHASEAVCVRTFCLTEQQTACTTRILPKDITAEQRQRRQQRKKEVQQQQKHSNKDITNSSSDAKDEDDEVEHERSNLLVLMIDPISRARFQRSLVKTNRLIQRLKFTSFSQYTAVGNNSGPNQAALYSGRPLASRASIASHNAHRGQQWLWDTLREHGYATLKAEDGCIENSNMIQSIQPKVHHGDAFIQMMCFDFERPNCLGGRSAPRHFLEYGAQFIHAYEQPKQPQDSHRQLQQPWAAFLHFIDSHEDTQTMEGTLDEPLWKYLFSIYQSSKHCRTPQKASSSSPDEFQFPCSVWNNTMIVLISDHGLHYGSYLLSRKGLQERSQPMLHLHLPENLQSSSSSKALAENKHLWTTPFDVYETIFQTLLPDVASRRLEPTIGSTLLQSLPENRTACNTTDGVPPSVCQLLEETSNQSTIMPSPPSVMSFYADIPRSNKVGVTPPCKAQASNDTIFTKRNVQCLCATNLRPWYNCSAHPWAVPSNLTPRETFSLVDCLNDRSFEVHVQRDPAIVRRYESIAHSEKSVAPSNPQQGQSPPNILFLELDSVSKAYADRHFPRTRELLHSLRLRPNSTDPSGFSCGGNETLCAAEFQSFSVVGANSMPNQIAAFGGCVVTAGPERCFELERDEQSREICVNASHFAYNMELVSRHKFGATYCRVDKEQRSPWIFDIAKSAGYVTMFAEEFCFEDSVYVPQGNIFPLNVDYVPSKFFCRVVERYAVTKGFQMVEPPWKYEYFPKPNKPACVDDRGGYERARVALDHIESMWNSYEDVPKLAYLNALAAHVYQDFKS